MNTVFKRASQIAIAALMSATAMLFSASSVYADGPALSATPTATPASKETRVECTTGAYGQQTCKTVVVEKVASPSGIAPHQVVKSGIQEDIIVALIAIFAISTFGYTYSKVRA